MNATRKMETQLQTEATFEAHRPAMPVRAIGALCVCFVFGMLVAGLWPFCEPLNDVTWIANTDGIRFGNHGTLLSSSTFGVSASESQVPSSLEISLYPYDIRDTGTVFAFYSSDDLERFSLRQNRAALVLSIERVDKEYRPVTSRIFVDNFFRQARPVVLAITSRANGTVIYRDGASIKTLPWFKIVNADLTGRLVVGTSPIKNDSWPGELRRLAIYGREFTDADVLRHYRESQPKGRPYAAEDERSIALYLFNEHTGKVVHNLGGGRVDLYIPKKYTILHEKLLEPAWQEFSLGWSYWKSALINVVGFVPLGFFFCTYWSSSKSCNRAALATVILGMTISFAIEVLQAYLPTRDSGTTDLITNTFGTFLGVMLYRWRPSLLSETLNRLTM